MRALTLALRAARDAATASRRALSSSASSSSSWWTADADSHHTLGGRTTTPTLAPPSGSALAGVGWAARRWMAVPKKKVSPSRRGIRNGRKHIPRVHTMAKCSRCGAIMHVWQVPQCDDASCPSLLEPEATVAAAPSEAVAKAD